MIKLDKTVTGLAVCAALALLAACQKTDAGATPKAAADVSQTAPAAPSAPANATEGESEQGPGAGADDRAHGPRAGMEMGREARERGMGMAPKAAPPAEKPAP
ncbi:hypothetical protein [uncultured Phenylobacterium sp.]|uniref:hypothetical protein n=1 Tax=uncultured Phenylobacterium sp. TaxID=349273 RepID=UPI0025D9A17C|nr:hypothetical protein [uncultured Phenylobacterium sp.]